MAGSLGTAYVQIIPSAQGISGKIKEAIGGEASSAGKSAGSLLGGNIASTLKKVLASAAIGKAVKDTIMEGAELQQNLGGTEAVFGEFASSIQASAQEAYKNMGMSASEYMATANKMGSLFQGSGLTQQRALDLTSAAMQRAADVASVMGIDTASAMESITGAAKGNFTMMDNLGVAMNATTLQAYALEKGINFKWQTASNAQKAELAMQMFMERTSQYAGNFTRESEQTISGSLGAMQAAIKDVMGRLTLGMDIGPALNNLMTTATTFLTKNLIPAVLNIVSALPSAAMAVINALLPSDIQGAISGLIGKVSGFIRSSLPGMAAQGYEMLGGIITGMLQRIPELITFAGEMIMQFYSAIFEAAPSLWSAGESFIVNLVQGIATALPGIASAAVDVVSGFLDFLVENGPALASAGIELVLDLIQGLISALPEIATTAFSLITQLVVTLLEHAPDLIANGIELVAQLVAGLIQSLPDVINAAVEIGNGILDSLKSVDWIGLGADIIAGIVRGIMGAASSLYEALRDLASRALESAKSALGIKSPSRVFRDQVGRYISEGIAVGIEENTGSVTRAVQRVSTAASAGFVPSYDVSGFGDYSGAPRVQVVQNIYSEAKTASDLMLEARYNIELGVMGAV